MYQKAKNIVGRILGTNTAVEADNGVATCMSRLRNMHAIGYNPKGVFDCGASVGHWTWEAAKIFSGAQFVAVEPNPLIVPKTKELLDNISPQPIIEQSAIGAEDGTAYLNIWDNQETKMSGSSIKGHVQGDASKKEKVDLKKLDSISKSHGLKPDLIKLDLQGYELEALKGASELLQYTEVFIIEFGCLEAYIDRATPYDIMTVMYENDYCLYDIIDLIYRPYDNALTGGDFIYVKNDSPLKAFKGYS